MIDQITVFLENKKGRVASVARTIADAGVNMTALETLFSGRFYALELRDETRVRQDVWDRAGEDSLRGEFLRCLRRQFDAARDEQERERVTRAVRFGLAALDHRDIL